MTVAEGGGTMFTDLFDEIRLTRFRGFESYTLENLARVNLLVGKNNCGKTSVIEAIGLLAANGNPLVLEDLAVMRGERRIRYLDRPFRGIEIVDISPLFSGHSVPLGAEVMVASNRRGLSLQIVQNSEVDEYLYGDSDIRRMVNEGDEPPTLGLKIVTEGLKDSIPVFPLGEAGSLVYSNRLRRRSQWPPLCRSRFLTPTSLQPREMRTMWDKALRDGHETGVIRALQFLQGDIVSVHFLAGDQSAPDVLVGLSGGGRKLPMTSFGDGMRRLLALTLSLIDAANGVLLIDEIDAGMHWTVMEDMWRLVVETARKSSVQVFATTHSYDCVRGLASLVESCPDLAGEVSIQKIGRSLSKAVHLDAARIQVAVEQNIEVR